jgi:hypothetical protein
VGNALITAVIEDGKQWFSVDYQKVGNPEPSRCIFHNQQDALNWCLEHDYSSSKLFLKIYRHPL